MSVAFTKLSSELTTVLEAIRDIAAAHQVAQLEVFGSAVTGRLYENSDIDLLVVFKPMSTREHGSHYFGLKHDLEGVLERPVDLLELEAATNPYFLEAIESERFVLYAA